MTGRRWLLAGFAVTSGVVLALVTFGWIGLVLLGARF